MNVTLIRGNTVLASVIGKVTPIWVILHDGKFVCGGGTQYDALCQYVQPDTHGTIANHMRLGQYRKAAAKLRS